MLDTRSASKAFTIVELLVVIVIIAILAALTVVAYNGIQKRADDAAISSKESQAKKKLEIYKIENDDTYPPSQSSFDALIRQSSGEKHYFGYASSPPHTSYTLTLPNVGESTPSALVMQNITNGNCPTTRTAAVDARDNKTYWVQKLADGKCWMLTNLAYAGGGVNTHSDTTTMSDATSGLHSYTTPYYYIPPGANPTVAPAEPSSSTSGTGQYGYLYNWCAALGSQLNTLSCANAVHPSINTNVSVCPNGWRLPTGSINGEFSVLNNAINGNSTSSDAGLRATWLLQYGGSWWIDFSSVGSNGVYWSSTPQNSQNAFYAYAKNNLVNSESYTSKNMNASVRCVAR